MSDETPEQPRGLSRRRLMQGAAAVGVAAWIPFEQIPAAQSALPTPPSFPGGIPLFQQTYTNWSRRHRRRRRLDVYAEHARRRRHAGQLGAGQRLAAARQGQLAQLVAALPGPRRQRRGQRRAGRHQDQAHGHLRRHRDLAGPRADRRHDAGDAHRARERRPRAHRHAGSRRPDRRRRAGHRRARHRRAQDRRGQAGRPHLRLGQQPGAADHRGRVGRRDLVVRAQDLQPQRRRGRRADDARRSLLHHRGGAAGGRQPAAALPELVRHPGDRAVRTRGVERQDLRELPELRGPGRGDLVPVHPQAVAQGLERGADQADPVEAGDQPVQLHVQRQPAAVDLRPVGADRLGQPGEHARASATSTTTSSRPAWSPPSPTTSGAGRRTCCSTCGRRPCGSPPTATRSCASAPTCSGSSRSSRSATRRGSTTTASRASTR